MFLSLQLAVFDGCYLGDSGGMPAALKGGVQKKLRQLDGDSGTDDSSAHAEDVRVVVQTGVFCAEMVGAAGGADSFYLIGCHGHADSRAADENALFTFAACYAVSDGGGNGGVIDGFFGIGSKIPV